MLLLTSRSHEVEYRYQPPPKARASSNEAPSLPTAHRSLIVELVASSPGHTTGDHRRRHGTHASAPFRSAQAGSSQNNRAGGHAIIADASAAKTKVRNHRTPQKGSDPHIMTVKGEHNAICDTSRHMRSTPNHGTINEPRDLGITSHTGTPVVFNFPRWKIWRDGRVVMQRTANAQNP